MIKSIEFLYSMCDGLMQLAKYLDKGKGLDVSGIEDEFVRNKTMELFDNLVMQVKKRSDGTYVRRNGKSDTSVISFVAPILEESPEYLERFRNSLKESPVDGAQSDKKEMKKDISIQIISENATEDQEEQHETRISDQEEGEKCGIKEQGIEAKVCSIGPELPTADQFQQAAEIMNKISYMERKDGTDEDAFFIGPVPPEFEQEDLEGALHFSILGVLCSRFLVCLRYVEYKELYSVTIHNYIFLYNIFSCHVCSFDR